MEYLKTFLAEPGTAGKEGSSQRLLLFCLVLTILTLVSYLTIETSKLPEVPTSLETLVEWIGTTLVAGIFGGKAAGVVKAIKGGGDATPDAQA